MSKYLCIAMGSLFLLTAGCSRHPATVAVSGKVTLDRVPLARASIQFVPTTTESTKMAPQAFAVTDDQGNFKLKLGGDYGDVSGAPAGTYRVNIGKMDRDSKRGPRQTVPVKYNRNTQLSYTVPPDGTSEANFDLKTR